MSAKFVWGIVIIVIGVVGVITGFTQMSEASQLDDIMGSFARQFNAQGYMGEYINASRDAKTGGIIKIIGGVCFCIFGTWLMNEAKCDEKSEWASNLQNDKEWTLKDDKNDDWRF